MNKEIQSDILIKKLELINNYEYNILSYDNSKPLVSDQVFLIAILINLKRKLSS